MKTIFKTLLAVTSLLFVSTSIIIGQPATIIPLGQEFNNARIGPSDGTIAISPSGVIYYRSIGATTGYLSVTKFDGIKWESVGNLNVFSSDNGSSLAIDKLGNPYISFSDNSKNGKASVMKFIGNNWVYVGNAGFSNGAVNPSIMLDASGIPYVSYFDSISMNNYQAIVMKYNGSSWTKVGNLGVTGSGTLGLSIDSSGIPYVNYGNVSKYVGNSWIQLGNLGGYNNGKIAYEPKGTPYVFVYTPNDTNLSILKWSGTVWNKIGNGKILLWNFGYASYVIDKFGTPYVAYQDFSNNGNLSVKKFNGSSWVQVGKAGFGVGLGINDGYYLAIDTSDNLYASYTEANCNSIPSVMRFNGYDWVQIGTPGFNKNGANFTSLALDANGTPFVSYQDISNNYKISVMKYIDTNWVYVGLAGFSNGQANYPSMALDKFGTPYVAFEDCANGYKVTVMKYNGSSWVNVGNPGFSKGHIFNTSIAIDTTGIPFVAYNDSLNGDNAVVMKYNGSTWVNVGNSNFSSSQIVSFSINVSGIPYLLYVDDANYGYLSLVKFNGNNWENVGNAGFAHISGGGNYSTLSFDALGVPFVSYQDFADSNKISVVKFNGNNWVSLGQEGFTKGTLRSNSSLTIDASGTPFVAYMDVPYLFGSGGVYLVPDSSYKVSIKKFNDTNWVEVGKPRFTSGVGYAISLKAKAKGDLILVYAPFGAAAYEINLNNTSTSLNSKIVFSNSTFNYYNNIIYLKNAPSGPYSIQSINGKIISTFEVNNPNMEYVVPYLPNGVYLLHSFSGKAFKFLIME